MNSAIDMGFTAQALIADTQLTNEDILDAELERARHALAYLNTAPDRQRRDARAAGR